MFILLLLGCCVPIFGGQDFYKNKFSEDTNAQQAPERLLTLMRSYYEDASQRIAETNPMRFMYEESPYYEMGYVFHELIERYKKMVEEMNRIVNFKTNTLYDNVERTEMMQKLYFEVYHISNMIHEIPRKWKGIGEFKEKNKAGDMSEAIMNREEMEAIQERKRREDKEKRKLLKKRREMLEKGLLLLTERPQSAKRVPYNVHWPLDYGWEIDWW